MSTCGFGNFVIAVIIAWTPARERPFTAKPERLKTAIHSLLTEKNVLLPFPRIVAFASHPVLLLMGIMTKSKRRTTDT